MDSNASAPGSHVTHAQDFNYACAACHNGYTETTVAAATHVNQSINLSFNGAGAGTTYSQGATHAVGNNYGTCATSNCHGTTSPTWGAGSTQDCSLCHGMVTSATDDRDTSGTANNNTDPQIGAHEAHLNATHGYTSPITCDECHLTTVLNQAGQATYVGKVTAAGHIDSALPAELTFGDIADGGDNGQPAASPAYGGAPGGTCSNTYCHDGRNFKNGWSSAAEMDNEVPDWNIPNLAGNISDCNNCHGNPPATSHAADPDCSKCHSHVAANDISFTDPTLHINGIVEGGGCDGCHAYPPATGDGKAYMKVSGVDPVLANQLGKGGNSTHADVHTLHVSTIIAERAAKGLPNLGALDPSADQFGDTKVTAYCGACHNMAGANHSTDGNGTRDINFNGSNAYRFTNSGSPTYNGTPGTPDTKSCSNVSCHFKTSPEWQETAGQ